MQFNRKKTRAFRRWSSMSIFSFYNIPWQSIINHFEILGLKKSACLWRQDIMVEELLLLIYRVQLLLFKMESNSGVGLHVFQENNEIVISWNLEILGCTGHLSKWSCTKITAYPIQPLCQACLSSTLRWSSVFFTSCLYNV